MWNARIPHGVQAKSKLFLAKFRANSELVQASPSKVQAVLAKMVMNQKLLWFLENRDGSPAFFAFPRRVPRPVATPEWPQKLNFPRALPSPPRQP